MRAIPSFWKNWCRKLLTLGEVERVLEQLLRERVSIRDLGAILEALLEIAPVNKSLVTLVEAARQALGRRLIAPLLDSDGQLPVLLLDPAIEEEIATSLSPEGSQRLLSAASAPAVPIVRRLADSLKHLIGASTLRPFLCSFVQVQPAITSNGGWSRCLQGSRSWLLQRFRRRPV